MKLTHLLLTCVFLFCKQISHGQDLNISMISTEEGFKPLVSSMTQIILDAYPDAWNPSIIDYEEGYLMTFRITPDPLRLHISYIGVVQLDEAFYPISQPQLLDTHIENTNISSQAEDARIFSCNGNLYLVYNDNPTLINPTSQQRRDMYLAQLSCDDKGLFSLSPPQKIYHNQKYFTQKWQKNWVPFEWEGTMLFSYSLRPHEVLFLKDETGKCNPLSVASCATLNSEWKWGEWRGGTPALLVDEEYLGFFHSGIMTSSKVSNGVVMHHYYMGAYTFSKEPPYAITSASSKPIIGEGFYTHSNYDKRIVFPGGFVIRENKIHVAFGKDDREIWIATIDKQMLKTHLNPIPSPKTYP